MGRFVLFPGGLFGRRFATDAFDPEVHFPLEEGAGFGGGDVVVLEWGQRRPRDYSSLFVQWPKGVACFKQCSGCAYKKVDLLFFSGGPVLVGDKKLNMGGF